MGWRLHPEGAAITALVMVILLILLLKFRIDGRLHFHRRVLLWQWNTGIEGEVPQQQPRSWR
jgi:hypothetical protein